MAHKFVQFHNGQKMPTLGLGTWQATNAEELEKALNWALDAGYRHFDTAFVYSNEHIIGNVIKGWLDSGRVKREELFIVTKLPATGMEQSRVEHFLKLSLAALKLDYVDLYLIHMPIGFKYVDDATMLPREPGSDNVDVDMNSDITKVWKGMEAQVKAGRTKAIGVSNFTEEQVERIVASAEIKPANIQVEASVYFQQKPLRKTCAKHGITVCAYGAFGSPGRTTMFQNMGVQGFVTPDILNDPVVGALAKAHGKLASQVILRFLVQQDIVVIPKSTNEKRLHENIQIFDFELTTEDMKKLEALDKGKAGRSFDLIFFKGAERHPENPFRD